MSFIHIYSASSELCKMDHDFLLGEAREWLCTACMNPRPGTAAVDVRVRQRTVADLPLSAVAECNTMVARDDVLSAFPLGVIEELNVGRLLDESGNVISGFATVRARFEVVVRGSTNVSFRVCEDCGRVVYYAAGARYLYPAPIPASVWGSDLAGLVFRHELFATLGLNFSRRMVFVERLRVVEAPRDGLGLLAG